MREKTGSRGRSRNRSRSRSPGTCSSTGTERQRCVAEHTRPQEEHVASAELNELSKEFDDFVKISRQTRAFEDNNVPIIPDLEEETAE